MDENHIFLTDYLSDRWSLEKLKNEFSKHSNAVHYSTFRTIILMCFPAIAEENEKIVKERLQSMCLHPDLHEMKGRSNSTNSKVISSLSSCSFGEFSSVTTGSPQAHSALVQQAPLRVEENELWLRERFLQMTINSKRCSKSEAMNKNTKPSFSFLSMKKRLGDKKAWEDEKVKDGIVPFSSSPQQQYAPEATQESKFMSKEKAKVFKKNECDIGYGTKAFLRNARLSSKEELTRESTAEPLKNIFNLIDRRNSLAISWEDVLLYLVEECTQKTASFNQTYRAYSFSRKMKNNKVEESWILMSTGSHEDISPTKKKVILRNTKKNFCPAVHTAWKSFTPSVVPPLFFLPRLIHSLPGHWVFALSTRSTPLALYRKSDLSHVKTFTPADLGSTTPSFLDYLPRLDTIFYYSSEDSYLRGWTFLLSQNNSSSITPLRIEGAVQKMRTSPQYFPFSVFLATSHGKLFRVDVTFNRSGSDLRVVKVYEGLHDYQKGGILDFAVSETSFFSTGFDHRILSINIQTGQVTVIGSSKECVYLLDYCPTFSLVIGVSYQHELLYWDAKGLVAVPGTPFNCAREKGHFHLIKKLVCAKDLPHCVTVDCNGEVKMWDLKALECVQTIRIDGRSADVVDEESIYLIKTTPAASADIFIEPIVDVAYFEESHELVSCTKDTLYLLEYNLKEDVYICDLDQVSQIFYDVRERTFILQGSTRITTWDAISGVRKRFSDRAFFPEISSERKDIVALCVDDVGSRIFVSLRTKEIEVFDTISTSTPIELLRISTQLPEMLYSSYFKLLLGLSEDGRIFYRNEEEEVPCNVVSKIASTKLYSLSISETLGLLAYCSFGGSLFLHDLRKMDGAPQSFSVSQPILFCKLLECAPILASAHEKGNITLWSCPPIAEVFLSLITFNVFYFNLTELTSACCNGFESFQQFSKDAELAVTGSVTQNGEGISSPIVKKQEGEGEYDPSFAFQNCEDLGMGQEKKEKNKTEDAFLLEHFAGVTVKQREITSMAFDNISHHFFCSDSSGFVYFFSLCAFFQWFTIRSPGTEARYFLDHSRIGCQEALPQLVKIIQPHSKEGVITIQWVPYESVLLTSGIDRKVFLFNADGNRCGVLSKVRLSNHVSGDEIIKSSSDRLSIQQRRKDVPPYQLPKRSAQKEGCFLFSPPESDEKITSTQYFCHHPEMLLPETHENFGHYSFSDEKKNFQLNVSEPLHPRRSVVAYKSKSKRSSAGKLGEYILESLKSASTSENVRSPTKTKKVTVKASLGKKMAFLHVGHQQELSEKKVMVFPSTVRAETLASVEEARPHSTAGVPRICPVLFARECEPSTNYPVIPRCDVILDTDSSLHKEKIVFTQITRKLSPSPPVLPSFPPSFSLPCARLKTPIPKMMQTLPHFSFHVKGISNQNKDLNCNAFSVQENKENETRVKKVAYRTEKYNSSISSKEKRVGRVCKGKCHIGFSSAKPSISEEEGVRKIYTSPPSVQSHRASAITKSEMNRNGKDNPVDFLEQYRAELHRCIAGEDAVLHGFIPQNSKLAFPLIGGELKKVDRSFLVS